MSINLQRLSIGDTGLELVNKFNVNNDTLEFFINELNLSNQDLQKEINNLISKPRITETIYAYDSFIDLAAESERPRPGDEYNIYINIPTGKKPLLWRFYSAKTADSFEDIFIKSICLGGESDESGIYLSVDLSFNSDFIKSLCVQVISYE